MLQLFIYVSSIVVELEAIIVVYKLCKASEKKCI